MRPGWMATLAMAVAETAVAAECDPHVTAWLENSTLADRTVLGQAQGTAVRVFAQIGIKLEWRLGGPARRLPCGENLEIVLDEIAPPRFAPDALGYATVGAHGTAIHIFYYRVIRPYPRELAPALLGHVFAHEITHVLEDVARHAQTGVMKAHWTMDDFRDMARGLLPFAPVDEELMRARFARPVVMTN